MRHLRGRAHALLASTFLALSACGGAPPQGASAPPGEPESKGPVASAMAVDTSPVPMPEDLSGWIRVSSPAKDLPVLAGLLPQNAGELVEVLSGGPELVAVGFFGPDFAKALDFSKPMDVAIVGKMSDDPALVVSLAVKSLEEARRGAASLFELEPAGDQRYLLKAKRKERFLATTDGTACELVPAAGAAATRLVCGVYKDDVDHHAPFLARTLAPQRVESSLRMEFSERALNHSFESSFERTSSNLEGSAVEIAGARFLLAQTRRFFLEDLQNMGVDLQLGDGEINVGLDFTWNGANTPFSLALIGQPDAPVAAPPAFWRLPADTDLAFFIQGANPEEMKPQGRAFFQGLFAVVPDDVIPSTIREELTGALSQLLLTGGSMIAAHGVDRSRALSALSALGTGDTKAMAEAHRALRGYTLLHSDDPPDRLRASLKELFRISKKDKANRSPPESSPLVIRLGLKSNKRSVLRLEEIPQKASDKQPSGSLHFRAQVTPLPDYKPGLRGAPPLEVPYETHIWMVPDGTSTWIGMAEDEGLVQERLRDVLSGEASALLSRRSDLSPLLRAKGAWLGFATIGGATSLALNGDSRRATKKADTLLRLLSALPSRGETSVPMVMSSRHVAPLSPGGQASVRTRLEAQLPPKAVADLLRFVVLLTQVTP